MKSALDESRSFAYENLWKKTAVFWIIAHGFSPAASLECLGGNDRQSAAAIFAQAHLAARCALCAEPL
jgi:hypothetical protein